MTDLPPQPRRLIVGISGASGAILGIRLLETLARDAALETHLVITPAARVTIAQETDWRVSAVEALARVVHHPADIGASIASGSFATRGMIVAPCSMRKLSAIAHALDDDLLTRAAGVQLKEGRPVLLMARETPLHYGHIRAMLLAARAGAILMPPVPAFYTRPQTVDDIVNNLVGRALARIGLDNDQYQTWLGLRGK